MKGYGDQNSLLVAGAMGIYINKIHQELGYGTVLPASMLPCSAEIMHKFSVLYMRTLLKYKWEIKEFQVDGALLHTRFQNLTIEQYEELRSGNIAGFDEFIIQAKRKLDVAGSIQIHADYKKLPQSAQLSAAYSEAESMAFLDIINFQLQSGVKFPEPYFKIAKSYIAYYGSCRFNIELMLKTRARATALTIAAFSAVIGLITLIAYAIWPS